MRYILGTLCFFFLLTSSGCATFIHGTNQQVSISSTPTGASVRVNGQYYGITPLVLNLRRKEIHVVQFELAGYKPYEITLERAVSGWTVANVLFPDGLMLAALDGMDGAFYRLYPGEVMASLSPVKDAPPVRPEMPAVPEVSANSTSSKQTAQQLMDLKELLDAGVLSPQDYEERRAALLPLL